MVDGGAGEAPWWFCAAAQNAGFAGLDPEDRKRLLPLGLIARWLAPLASSWPARIAAAAAEGW